MILCACFSDHVFSKVEQSFILSRGEWHHGLWQPCPNWIWRSVLRLTSLHPGTAHSQRWETEKETSRFTRLLKCKADGENIAANASAHHGRPCLSVCVFRSRESNTTCARHAEWRASWPPIAYYDTRCLALCSLCACTFII